MFALDTLLRVAAAAASERPDHAAVARSVVDASPEWATEPGADRTRSQFAADLAVRLGDR